MRPALPWPLREMLAPEGDGLAVVDAGGNGDLHGLAPPDLTAAAAVLAGGVHDLALAAAAGAGAGGGEDAHGSLPPLLDLAAAVAVGAGLRIGTRSRAAAVAGVALLHPLQGDLLLTAEGRLLKGDGKAHPEALPPLGAGAAAGTAAKAAAEEAAEDIPQVAEVEAALEPAAEAAGPRAVAGVHSGEAELVVALALVAVAEDLIGLVDLLEPGLRPS